MTIARVEPNSISANAGLCDGDRLISIGGKKVLSASQASTLLETMRGDISIQVGRPSAAPPAVKCGALRGLRGVQRPSYHLQPSDSWVDPRVRVDPRRAAHTAVICRESPLSARGSSRTLTALRGQQCGWRARDAAAAQRPTLPGQPAHATQMQQLVPPPQTVAQPSPVVVEPTEWL